MVYNYICICSRCAGNCINIQIQGSVAKDKNWLLLLGFER